MNARRRAASTDIGRRHISIALAPIVCGSVLSVALVSRAAEPEKRDVASPEHDGASNSDGARGSGAATSAALIERPNLTLFGEMTEIDARLKELTAAVKKGEADGFAKTVLIAVSGLLGIVIGGVINVFAQGISSKRSAKHEIAQSLADWQIKQLSELYAPLHALLRETLRLYRLMNQTLVDQDPKRFRMQSSSEDIDEQKLEICRDGKWVRFRTVLHFAEVYGQQLGVDGYFDDILAIGVQMVAIIKEKAGYARANEGDLADVFGRYLAHFAVLTRLHDHMKERVKTGVVDGKSPAVPSPVSGELKSLQMAVFPQEIHMLISRGFKAISKDIEAWRAKALS